MSAEHDESKPSGQTVEPDLSLIVPTHDRPGFLAAAMESVVRQDWPAWECIVVDDGSDPPAAVPDDPRIRVVRHDSPRGPAAARNAGVRAARARYVGFMDDDDLIPPSRIRVAVQALDAAAEANCHVGALVRHERPELIDYTQPGPQATEEKVRTRTPSVGQLTLRREIVADFDEELRVGEDVEWWLRVEPTAIPIISDTITYLVRLHGTQRSGVSPEIRLQARLSAYTKNAPRLPRWSKVRARQQQRVASAALMAGRRGMAARFAVAALINRPSAARTRLAGRALAALAGASPKEEPKVTGS